MPPSIPRWRTRAPILHRWPSMQIAPSARSLHLLRLPRYPTIKQKRPTSMSTRMRNPASSRPTRRSTFNWSGQPSLSTPPPPLWPPIPIPPDSVRMSPSRSPLSREPEPATSLEPSALPIPLAATQQHWQPAWPSMRRASPPSPLQRSQSASTPSSPPITATPCTSPALRPRRSSRPFLRALRPA